MNKVVLIGRLTRDPELRYTGQGTAVARFTIAVNRRKQKDKPQEADFISCVAWGNIAENLSKYQSKGSQVAVHGRIQTGNYEKDGRKIYTTDVVAEEIEFLGSKNQNQNNQNQNNNGAMDSNGVENQDFGVPLDDFHPIDESDDDLPF